MTSVRATVILTWLGNPDRRSSQPRPDTRAPLLDARERPDATAPNKAMTTHISKRSRCS